MTANDHAMSPISNDRSIPGLGARSRRLSKALHGRSFKAPLTLLKETVEIIKLAFATAPQVPSIN
jgi:hypothetical protein